MEPSYEVMSHWRSSSTLALNPVFCVFQIFYVNPRYVLFIHLVLNDMIQLTVSVILFILSYIFYTINVCLCCHLIVLAALTTQNTPLNLVGMAAECCVAVCLPLRHSQLCTLRRTYALIGLIWLTSAVAVVPDLLATLATEPPDFFSSRVFCIRNNVFPGPTLATKVWVYNVVFLVVVWLALAYAYFRILFAAKGATSDGKKAQNTILLHGFQLLLSTLTYIAPILKEALYLWFPQHYATSLFICYVIIQILPRFLSPMVYGLRDQMFRKYLRGHLLCRTRTLAQ